MRSRIVVSSYAIRMKTKKSIDMWGLRTFRIAIVPSSISSLGRTRIIQSKFLLNCREEWRRNTSRSGKERLLSMYPYGINMTILMMNHDLSSQYNVPHVSISVQPHLTIHYRYCSSLSCPFTNQVDGHSWRTHHSQWQNITKTIRIDAWDDRVLTSNRGRTNDLQFYTQELTDSQLPAVNHLSAGQYRHHKLADHGVRSCSRRHRTWRYSPDQEARLDPGPTPRRLFALSNQYIYILVLSQGTCKAVRQCCNQVQ